MLPVQHRLRMYEKLRVIALVLVSDYTPYEWGREHSAFPVHWSGILSLSHCGLLVVSQLFVAGLRLILTSTYHDFIFTLLVFSIIVDICTARPTRVVVGLALNTVM